MEKVQNNTPILEISEKPTLKLIAERTGVSVMTVSRILRNYPNHDPGTREKVLRVAEQLNYKKNPLISALMVNIRHKKPTHFRATIALVQCIPADRPLSAQRINLRKGIVDEARRNGFEVETFDISSLAMTPDRLLKVIDARGIKCLIIENFLKPNIKLDLNLDEFASVTITNSLIEPRINRVEPDHHCGFLLAIEKMRENGYERFGFISDHLDEAINQNRRLAAFLLSGLGIPKRKSVPMLWLDPDETIMKSQLHRWLIKHKPEVILTSISEVVDWIRQLGYNVPENIGFVHLDINENNHFFAGINHDWHEVGALAANQVMELLVTNHFGAPKQPKVTFSQPIWVGGKSLPQKLIPSY